MSKYELLFLLNSTFSLQIGSCFERTPCITKFYFIFKLLIIFTCQTHRFSIFINDFGFYDTHEAEKVFKLFSIVPLELPIIIREHFNRWYSLKSYYLATTIADTPIQVQYFDILLCLQSNYHYLQTEPFLLKRIEMK